MIRLSRITLLAMGSMLLSVVLIIVTTGLMLWSWSHVMAAGHLVTVPITIDLDLDVEKSREMALWRELEGTHVTINRPLLSPPEDQAVTITDRRSGVAIPLTDNSGYRVRQQVMPGFSRNRRGVVTFDAPEHGEITLSVAGSFQSEQVYRVAPGIQTWATTVLPAFQIGVGAGLILLVIGIGLLVFHALRQERKTLEIEDQPFA